MSELDSDKELVVNAIGHTEIVMDELAELSLKINSCEIFRGSDYTECYNVAMNQLRLAKRGLKEHLK